VAIGEGREGQALERSILEGLIVGTVLYVWLYGTYHLHRAHDSIGLLYFT
jgi:hypothetical protein